MAIVFSKFCTFSPETINLLPVGISFNLADILIGDNIILRLSILVTRPGKTEFTKAKIENNLLYNIT